ncbi:MAG: ABC transporter substrate-binding protein [Candidatus Hodarchaeota archaeon]
MKKTYIYATVIIVALVLVVSATWYLTLPKTEEKVTISFVYISEKTRNLAWTAIIERFEKENPNIEVDGEAIAQSVLHEKTIQMVETGTTPDVYVMYEHFIGEFYAMGALEDLTDRTKALPFYDDFSDIALVGASVDGKILAVPQTLYNDGIYVRNDRIEDLGLSQPSVDWTWDEFLDYAKKLTRDIDNDGITDQYGFGMRGDGLEAVKALTAFIYAGGGDVYKDGEVVINSPEAVEAAEWYIDLFRTQKVAPPSAPTDGWFGIVEGFGRGTTSMYLHNCGSIHQQNVYIGSANYANLPLPIGPANRRVSYMGQVGLAIFKGTEHIEEAWKFIEFCVSDWAMTLWNDAAVQLPPRESLAAQPIFAEDPHLSAFVASFPFLQANPYLVFPAWGGIASTKGVALFQQALVGEITAQEMLDQLANELEANM